MAESTLREVTEWGWRQADYLTPTQHHVLLYLSQNAFLTEDNPEGAMRGQVYRARTSMAAIRRGTGLSERTVRDALRALQDQAYVLSEMSPGYGVSRIVVFWNEVADALREDFRAGVKPLPKVFRRPQRVAPETQLSDNQDNIVQFPYRQQLPQ